MFNLISRLFGGNSTQPKVVIGKKGRDEWTYKEGDHRMIIYAELQFSQSEANVEIDFGSIWRWEPPHNGKVLSWDERDRILQNFCRYLDSRKMTYTVRKQTGEAKS